MLFNASAFGGGGGGGGGGGYKLNSFQTLVLSPSLMQLSEVKQAVTCDKNSGCRLHEHRRSGDAYELHYLPRKCSSTIIYLWPTNFLRSSYFCCKNCKASVIVPASVERT